jgi:2-polyprenyl-3-methyl-5-hydroxy-6-metoxy-1,4-benzoquinol methylase
MLANAVPCAICEVDDARHLLTKRGYALVRCRRCRLVYVSPRPAAAELAGLYDTQSFHHHQAEADEQQRNLARDRARAELIARHQPGLGRLLDVGCSTGSFLRAAGQRGFSASGIDVGPKNVDKARTAGLDAHVATLDDAPFAPRSFDVITLFDSIEHMPEPVRALATARELLARGGLLVVTTPNVDGWFPRLTWQLFGRTLGAWEHPSPPAHVYQFSRDTLDAALAKAGFRTCWSRTEAIPVEYSVDELEEALLDAFKERLARPGRARASAPSNGAPADPAPPVACHSARSRSEACAPPCGWRSGSSPARCRRPPRGSIAATR